MLAAKQASTGLIFKSIVQKPVNSNVQDAEVQEGVYRYVVLYLRCFKDAILVPPGYKLEVSHEKQNCIRNI